MAPIAMSITAISARKKCNHKFNVLVDAIFENMSSLRKWFIAMYLISSHKKGIASHQLARDIKVTRKTVCFMVLCITRP